MGNTVKKSGGNQFYVIGSGSGDTSPKHLIIVNTIAERNALTNTESFVFVRDAYKGDNTVHRGWAMYVYVKDSGGVGRWAKTAEEESVDGVWGVKAEILGTVATKLELNAVLRRLNEIDKTVVVPSGETITPIGDVWDEEDLVIKINEIIAAINTLNTIPEA